MMKKGPRRLSLSLSGQWYLVLTIALGVAALTSGNNALYLIESLLLSGLILSGILSEQTISSLKVDFRRAQAEVDLRLGDWISVENTSNRPLFCVEIGEWVEGKFKRLKFIEKIGPRETLRFQPEITLSERGEYRWDGFAIATSYPFGFARKTKVIYHSGHRIVWPARSARKGRGLHGGNRGVQRMQASSEIAEGEIRPYLWTDDARLIVANQSRRGQGPMVRNRRQNQGQTEVSIDLRADPGERFEEAVRAAASEIYAAEDAKLTVIGAHGKKRINGKSPTLNTLALAKAEGKAG